MRQAVEVKLLMIDPVIAADGHSYERSAILRWHTWNFVRFATKKLYKNGQDDRAVFLEARGCYRPQLDP